MKVLVTGGAGYLGTELVYELVRHDAISEILVYDNLSRGNYNFFLGHRKLDRRVRFLQADVLDTRALRAAIQGAEVVYHLAAKVTTPFADQNAHQFTQINQWGTAELTYAVEQSQVAKLVFLSSASVYGSSTDEMGEESPPLPGTIYGKSKRKGEQFVTRLSSERLAAFVIRCGNVYGYSKNMRFDSVINRFVFDANFQRRISIHGDGEQHRPFVHVDRAANVLGNLIFSTLSPGIYNLVDQSWSVNFVADTLDRIFPGLERIYMNQDLQLRQLKVRPNQQINALADTPQTELEIQLREFAQRFTF